MKWRHPDHRPIRDAKILSDSLVERLESIHVATIEELVALGQISSLAEIMQDHLEIEAGELQAAFGIARAAAPDSEGGHLAALGADLLATMPFGALAPTDAMLQEMEPPGAPSEAAEFFLAPLAQSSVNHIPALQPVRAQGRRGTCVAFGTVCLREFLLERPIPLSEQFLYWGAKQRDGRSDAAGTWIRFAIQCLEEEGICSAELWPYNPEPGETESQGPPPQAARAAAAALRIDSAAPINPKSVNDLRAILLGTAEQPGRVVPFAVPVFRSWHENPITYRTGRLPMPLPGEPSSGGHCMCLVGFQDDPEWPGGGHFILRNSWGTAWAAASSYGPGYGAIPYAFIARHCWEAYTATVDRRSRTGALSRSQGRSTPSDRPRPAHQAEHRAPARSRAAGPARSGWHSKLTTALVVATVATVAIAALFSGAAIAGDSAVLWMRAQLPERGVARLDEIAGRWQQAGDRAFDHGLYAEAASDYRWALRFDPGNPERFARLGRARYGAGDLDGAVAAFRAAVAAPSDHSAGSSPVASLRIELALLLLEAGEEEDAEWDLETAIDLDPDSRPAAELRGGLRR